MNEKTNLTDAVKDAIEKIRSMADTKTVIGEPINVCAKTTILPVSKMSIGLGIGGGEYGKNSNAGSGGGTGLTVTPVCFLVIDNETGDTKLLNVGENTGYDSLGIISTVNGIDKALDKAPDIIDKVKVLFKKKEDKAQDGQNDETDK